MRGPSTSGEVWKDPFTRQGTSVNEDSAQRPASRLEGRRVVGKDLCIDKGKDTDFSELRSHTQESSVPGSGRQRNGDRAGDSEV